MPVSVQFIDCATCCLVSRWQIEDIDGLAEAAAFALAGCFAHAEKIISRRSGRPPRLHKALDAAINKLRLDPEVEKAEGPQVWHRDGLLFQVVSWAVAHKHLPQGAALASPHVIKAHKGIDGVQLELASDQSTVSAITIFEDKAGNPEKLVKAALKEFSHFETDETHKADELLAICTALLDKLRPSPENHERIVQDTFWLKHRRYRASLVVLEDHATADGAATLFSGFEAAVPGEIARRRGEMLPTQDVRSFFRGLSALVITKLELQKSQSSDPALQNV